MVTRQALTFAHCRYLFFADCLCPGIDGLPSDRTACGDLADKSVGWKLCLRNRALVLLTRVRRETAIRPFDPSL